MSDKDSLLDAETRDRVNYALGVLLDAGDFLAEQTYHRGRLARALAYLHGIGTVAGLKVTWKPPSSPSKPDEEEIAVDAGIALDQFGRLVEIPVPACIKLNRWYWQDTLPDSEYGVFDAGTYQLTTGVTPPATAVVADLFLRFRECERGKTPAFAAGPFDATDAVVPSRMRDAYELKLMPRPLAYPPPNVPAASTFPPATVASPTDPQRQALRDAIYNAWRKDRQHELEQLWTDQFLPNPLRFNPDQTKVADPAWVFLARVMIPASKTTTTTQGTLHRPTRVNTPVVVDNDLRPFSVTAAALVRWLGIF